MKAHERCAVCGYLFERDYGDTWGVWIVTDRIPLAIGIVAVYFGFRVTNPLAGLVFLCSLTIPLILTMPRRHGVAIALVYISRRRFPDSNDPIPALPPRARTPPGSV
jgi:hypothetical protein